MAPFSSNSSSIRSRLSLFLFLLVLSPTVLIGADTTTTISSSAAHAQTAAAVASKSVVRMVSWNVQGVRSMNFVMDRVAILTTQREAEMEDDWCMGLLVAPDALLTYASCVEGKSIEWAFFGNLREDFYSEKEPQDEQQDQTTTTTAATTTTTVPTTTGETSDGNVKREKERDPQAAKTASSASSTEGHNTSSSSSSSSSSASSSAANSTLATDTTSNNVKTTSTRRLRSEHVDVGDVEHWIPVIEIIYHPDYDAKNKSAATDMAIVRLQTPRSDIEPFQLLPDEASVANMTNVEMTNTFEAYRVTNQFIVHPAVPKVQTIGVFRRVSWYFCALSSVNGETLSRDPSLHQHEMCVVPQRVQERKSLNTINSFVLVGNQLAGLSVCHSKDCKKAVAHPYVLVSGIKNFIEQATQKQDVWTNQGLFTIGGSETALQGYLSGLRKTKDAQNFCLGTLIAPSFVLTAAHCVKDVAFSFVSVGSKYASSETDGEQIRIKSVKIHPGFNAKTLLNDFAIVELMYISIQPPLVLDNEKDTELYGNTLRLTLYGYEELKSKGEKAKIQSLSLPLVHNSVCNSLIGDSSLDATIVCAGGEEGKDGCQGDSGAPLVQELNGDSGSNNDKYLVALSSFGWGCGIKDVPAVYAKVSAAASFIENNVFGHSWRYKLDSSSSITGSTTPSTPTPPVTSGGDDSADQNSHTPVTTRPQSRSPGEEEERSGEGATSGEQDPAVAAGGATSNGDNARAQDEFIDSLCREEQWSRATSIEVPSNLQTFVIPVTTSQFTRDTVATMLLMSKEHVSHEEIQISTSSSSSDSNSGSRSDSDFSSADCERRQQTHADAVEVTETKYSCTGSIQMYSSGNLEGIETKLAEFESRPLRKRKARFARAPGMVRLPDF